MRKFFSMRSQQENTAAELMGETEDNPEEFPIKSATVQPQTPVSAPTTLVTSGETTPNAKPAFKSIKPNIKKTVIGNTTSDEPVVTRPKHRRTHSGFDQVTLENKVFTYEIEGLGKFEYNGTVDQNGVKTGRGELKYPNGTIYEGDFSLGKRHGFGKLIFETNKRTNVQSLAIGQWKSDMPSDEIPWKITHSTWEYWGNIVLDKKKQNVELLTIEDFLKNKQGELYDVKSNFKYFGTFKENKKEGFGVSMFSNGDRYYGGWKDDYLHDSGTYLFKDGTIFQGIYKRGVRTGKGTLYVPNGDTIEGVWLDDKVEGAVWKKGTTKDVTITMLNQVQNEIVETLRSNSNIGFMVRQNEEMGGLELGSNGPPTKQKWQMYHAINEQAWLRESDLLRAKLVLTNGWKGDLKDKQYIMNDINDVKRVMQVLFDGTLERDQEGFVLGFIKFFLSCFHGSYYTGGASSSQLRKKISNLMSHAIDDVKSFVEYLNDMLNSFMMETFDKIIDTFNNSNLRTVVNTINSEKESDTHIPNKVYSWDVSNEVKNLKIVESLKKLKDDVKLGCQSIIANHIHTKAYQTFFPLYEVSNQEKDLLMNQKINSVPNCSLASMGVDRKFVPPTEYGPPYEKSIKQLELMLREKNVMGKIRVLAALREIIMNEIRLSRTLNRQEQFRRQNKEYTASDQEEDENWQPGADDVTSVYSYVFLRARIRNHHAQFYYINDWKDHEVINQPVVHLITFYEGFLSFVMDLDPNLRTEEGQFISTYTISKSLERGVERQIIRNKNQPFSFYWLPSLLCHIGLEIGGLKINTYGKSISPKDDTSPIDKIPTLIIPTVKKSTLVIPPDQEILDMNNQNLMNTLIDNIEMVTQVLTTSNPDAGFIVKLEKNEEGANLPPLVVIEFDRVYPSHVYSELSLLMSKFVRFELDYLIL